MKIPRLTKIPGWTPCGRFVKRGFTQYLAQCRRRTDQGQIRYDTARTLKNAQDGFCEKVLSGDWRSLGNQKFPENLQWQPLVDILRGRIKVTFPDPDKSTHTVCSRVHDSLAGPNSLLRSSRPRQLCPRTYARPGLPSREPNNLRSCQMSSSSKLPLSIMLTKRTWCQRS